MKTRTNGSLLGELSSALAGVVETVGPSVVRVDDGTRLTATGVVWTGDGVIVTTSHGVERDEELVVESGEGKRYAAELVGRDADTDLAVLRVKNGALTPVQRAPHEDVKIGQIVLALGRPGDSGLQATIGIIGARMESQTSGQPGYILNTDAVLYPGFSGGPLVDVNGHVVGLNNLMFGRGRGVAVGTPVVAAVTSALLSHGRVQRGYLGVRTQSVEIPDSLKLKQRYGALIIGVESGSSAEKAGLMLGDVILGIDGRIVDGVDDLRAILRGLPAGQSVGLRVLRGGTVTEVKASLGNEG